MNKTVMTMAITRFIFGIANLTAAFLMLKFGKVEKALAINGVLGSIGPFIFLSVSAIGISSIAGKIPVVKLVMIIVAIILIFFSTR